MEKKYWRGRQRTRSSTKKRLAKQKIDLKSEKKYNLKI